MSADDLSRYLTRIRATNDTAAIEDNEIRVSTVHVYPSGPEVWEYHTQEDAANAANSLRAHVQRQTVIGVSIDQEGLYQVPYPHGKRPKCQDLIFHQ